MGTGFLQGYLKLALGMIGVGRRVRTCVELAAWDVSDDTAFRHYKDAIAGGEQFAQLGRNEQDSLTLPR
jgi:hypothetical protein